MTSTQNTARNEEEESSDDETASGVRKEGDGHSEAVAQVSIRELLENLRRCCAPADDSPATPVDEALKLLRDRAALSRAQEALSLQSQDKSLDIVFRARICAMVGVLNLFLDPDLPYTWRKASMVVAKAQGCGSNRARCICGWVLDFVRDGKLPLHSYRYSRHTILEDEGILQELHEQLTERAKANFIKAEDLCEIIASERVQMILTELGIRKPSISLSTAHWWLGKLKWRYGKKANGMYYDGHEREDVVAYRQAFVYRWAEYETRFRFWDDDGNPLPRSSNSFPLILVTHDESVFFQNDERKTSWGHQDSKPTPKLKGEGQSLMVSDFLTVEWGRLRNSDR